MVIEQASPEQQANLDSMSVEQLESMVSQEEGAAPVEGQATTQAKGEAVGSESNTEAPKADAEPAWFTAYKAEQKRELEGLRSLNGLKDRLPSLIEKQVNQRLQALQKAQTNANLSPEDQQAQAQLQTQQEALQNFVKEQAQAIFGEAAKDYLPLLSELQEQRQDAKLIDSVSSLVSGIIPDMNREKFASLFEGLAEKIEAGDRAATQHYDRLVSDPSFAALELIKRERGQVQQQAQQVTQKRTNMAQQAAQGVKSSAVAASGKKSVAEMSQTELDSMSIADLEAALP